MNAPLANALQDCLEAIESGVAFERARELTGEER